MKANVLTKKGELKQQVILLLIAVCLLVIGFTIPEIKNQWNRPKHYEQDGRNLQNFEGENLELYPLSVRNNTALK